MHIDFDRLDKLVEETGKTKSHLCRSIGKTRYYLRDVKKLNLNVSDDLVETLAAELGTTADYLTGQSDIKEKPTLNEGELDLSGISAVKRDFISAVMDLDDDQVQALSALVVKLKAGR